MTESTIVTMEIPDFDAAQNSDQDVGAPSSPTDFNDMAITCHRVIRAAPSDATPLPHGQYLEHYPSRAGEFFFLHLLDFKDSTSKQRHPCLGLMEIKYPADKTLGLIKRYVPKA